MAKQVHKFIHKYIYGIQIQTQKNTPLYDLVVTEEESGQGVPEAEEVTVREGRDLVPETNLI